MKNRRQSRETAFILLFEWSFNETKSLEEVLKNATDARDVTIDKFTQEILDKTCTNIDEIDKTIEEYSESWKLNRISRVCLACLRIALSELMYFEDIPEGATINEAVEIAKKYGSDDEPAFVNGLLGNFVKKEAPLKEN